MSSEDGVREEERKRQGAFFTPEPVARTLVRWAVRGRRDALLDPSCGDGVFLACHRRSSGIERDDLAARAARRRAPWARVHAGDFFAWAARTPDRFEGIAGNPPFIRYQRFSGATRARAQALCRRLGTPLSALASSWAPFLVASTGLLRRGGRLAMVVPAEIGHAGYAAPVVEHLLRSFGRVQIIAIRERIFPELSEDAWLVVAHGFGRTAEHVLLTQRDRFVPSSAPPEDGRWVHRSEWIAWNRRLRTFLLGPRARAVYERARHDGAVPLGAIARVGIGYVSGANDFFHLRPSVARAWGIEPRFLVPTVRSAKSLAGGRVEAATVAEWRARDEPNFLLRLDAGRPPSGAVRSYLDSPAGRRARLAYKCKVRDPWYAVPGVHSPDAFLSYMSGNGASLAENRAGCACSNTVHSVRLRARGDLAALRTGWAHPLARTSCEVEGHPLGGGLLKLEPGEAARVLLATGDAFFSRSELSCLEEAAWTMRRWRHAG